MREIYVLLTFVLSELITFSGAILKGGSTVTVWSGRDSNQRDHAPSSYFWTKRFMWNDNGDAAALYTSDGSLVSHCQYFPVKVPKNITPPEQKK